MTSIRAVSAVLAALISVPSAAFAQPAPQSAQSELEELHQALRLAPQQEGAWAAYRSASDAPMQAEGRRQAAAAMFRNLDAPRRLDLVQAEMEAELADLRRQSQALKALYAVLSPEQRVIFDQRTLPPSGEQQGPQMGPPRQ